MLPAPTASYPFDRSVGKLAICASNISCSSCASRLAISSDDITCRCRFLPNRSIKGATVFSVIDNTARPAADAKNERLICFRRFMLGPLFRDEPTKDRAIAREEKRGEPMFGCRHW
jgi:hypothetical protein